MKPARSATMLLRLIGTALLFLGCARIALPPPTARFLMENKPDNVRLTLKTAVGEELCYDTYSQVRGLGKREKMTRLTTCVRTDAVDPAGNFTKAVTAGGKTITIRTNPIGKLLYVSDRTYVGIIGAGTFPDHPLGIGDSWSNDITHTIFLEDRKALTLDIKTRSTLEDFVLCGGRECAKISTHATMGPFMEEGYRVRITGTETSYFDYENGQPVQREMKLVLRVSELRSGRAWKESLYIFQELRGL